MLLGLLPWALTLGAFVINAIESTVPLPLAVAAWVVLLVPLWVLWFGVLAWNKRHESAVPAVLMALPPLLVTVLFMVGPSGNALP